MERRFHDDVLDELRSDLFFWAEREDGSELGIYLLFEHQSTSPPHMAFRILDDLVGKWREWSGE